MPLGTEHTKRPPPREAAARRVSLRELAPGSPGLVTDDPTLLRYVWTVVERWPTFLAVLGAALAGGVLYLLTATPIYHSDAIVQVEPRTRGATGLEEILGPNGLGPAETEIAIIRSRTSLTQIVEELGLDLTASPRRFPLVGGALTRRHRGPGLASAPPGLSSFAWGGEQLTIRRLELPGELLGRRLRLTAGEAGRWRLSFDGETVLEGQAGAPASGRYRDRPVELDVGELVARPHTQFDVVKRGRSQLVAGLQEQLRIAESGRLSGILVISLDGSDPARTAAILDAVAANYVRQNVDRKAAEAAQQLAFLESQLPIVKGNVSAAEEALNKFLKTHGSTNLSRETQSLLDRSAILEREISTLELEASDLRQRFTANHPSFATLNEKMMVLRSERASINARTHQLPEAEANLGRLQRDVRVATELYNLLLNKSQELRILKSGTVGNVRIVDQALVPEKPAWPKTSTVLALATLLGVMGGIGAAFVRKALSQGAKDPEDIEASTGLAVYSAIPHSDREQELRRRRRIRGTREPTVLAESDPRDQTVEAFRSLRTSLQFALVEARNNVVLISGPSPGVGKSFVSVNLADVLATPERRVLLVDGDLRRGRVHQFFGLDRRPGLSDAIGGSVALAAAVHPTKNPSLDVLTTGSVPPNAAELIASQRFEALLESLSRSYAYVLVDTPPALAVTDAVVMARLAGVNFLVLKEGQHSMREIALCVKRFTQNGVTVHGAVLNDVHATLGRYGRHGRYQRYEYEPDHA